MREADPSKLGPIGHINGFIVKRLRESLILYGQEDRFKLIDYLSEWALFYPKDKHIVELFREKIEKNKKEDQRHYTTYDLYSYTSLLLNKAHRPEIIMNNLLGEDEWAKIHRRISLRNYIDSEFVRTTTEKYLNNNISQTEKSEGFHIGKKD